jgi:hypothetical protein
MTTGHDARPAEGGAALEYGGSTPAPAAPVGQE